MGRRLDIHTNLPLFLALAGGIYVLLVLMIQTWPAWEMARRYPEGPPRHEAGDWVARGRDLYVSYGCIYCHTQQIRGEEVRLPDDTRTMRVLGVDRRFGLDSPTRAEDYVGEDPPLLGSQRTGPDLTAVGTRLPDTQWHYWHLYNPRAVSPDSNMPAMPWLFRTRRQHPDDEPVQVIAGLGVKGNALFASPDARALVAYLRSLERTEVTRAPRRSP